MKIKWLYKIALPTIASAMVAPVVVSCSVEKPKVETQEEKEKRLEHQRAMEIAPNLTKFMKEYNNKLDRGESKYFIKSIKQLKEHTSNINHLNDFEKSYLGLYEDIQNFFDKSVNKYTKDNISFDYLDDATNESESKSFYVNVKLDENTLSQEQMFYHKIFQIMNDKNYIDDDIEGNENTIKHFKEALTPLLNEKITEFSKKHKDFQFKNPTIKFKYGKNGEKIIEVSVEIEYQNQKLPKELIIPLTFDLKQIQNLDLKTEKELIEFFKEKKEKINSDLERKNVKTFAEIENVLNSKPNKSNKEKLKYLKEDYKEILDTDKEVEI